MRVDRVGHSASVGEAPGTAPARTGWPGHTTTLSAGDVSEPEQREATETRNRHFEPLPTSCGTAGANWAVQLLLTHKFHGFARLNKTGTRIKEG